MNSETLWELVKVFLAALFASALTHLLTHRRFIQGRWWDRKADAYGSIIGSLVGLVYSLDLQIREEESLLTDPRYTRSANTFKIISREYRKAWERLERAVTEGDYVISEKASGALAELREAFERPISSDPYSTEELLEHLRRHRTAAKACLDIVRDEAKSDLRVKWHSW